MTVLLHQPTITFYFLVIYYLISKTLHNSVALSAQQCNLLMTFGVRGIGHKYACHCTIMGIPLGH